MLFVKAKSFIRAMWSFLRYGDAPIEVHDQRQFHCLRCDEFDVVPTGMFCEACHCPRWPLSDMRSKWRMRDVKCPQGKW